MTVIDELLVLLEDGQERTLDDCTTALDGRTRQTLSSTLGRLAGRGWVKVKTSRSSPPSTYVITDEGEAMVTQTLDQLRLVEAPHDGRWLFVLFNVPERQRKYRDILRNRLIQYGFGRIQNSLWVSARDVRFTFEDLLLDERLQHHTTILRPTLSAEDAQHLVAAFEWEWKVLAAGYARFSELAGRFLKQQEQSSLGARLLVYRYAKLLSQDPKLPEGLEPEGYDRKRAHALYEKVRPFCYAA
ncbi:hypothetical protein HY375_03690 [Candidatus Berkelbacteria bacterium]|nr:hypothetical protein [Candidatus Berkelbacteria bacterium]